MATLKEEIRECSIYVSFLFGGVSYFVCFFVVVGGMLAKVVISFALSIDLTTLFGIQN